MRVATRVVIRTDATPAIGAGHAMRCLALARALRLQGAEVFLFGDVGTVIAARYAEAGAVVVAATPEELADREVARNRLEELLSSGTPAMSWAVFDGYGFDAGDHAAARQAGARVLCIDDYGHLRWYDADIILNQNISADVVQYTAAPDSVLLRGLQYVLLRPEFEPCKGQALSRKWASDGCNVLLSMGGADPDNAAQSILDAFPADMLPRVRLHLLVGPHNIHRSGLEAWIRRTGARATIHTAVADMPALLQGMDFAVTAGGSTCWELMCMGVPFITVVLADNQRGIAEGLDAKGIAPCAGRLDAGSSEPVLGRVAVLLRQYLEDSAGARDRARQAMQLVDGRGAARVAATMLLNGYFLRPMVHEDCDALWGLVNIASVRAVSFNSAPIELASHRQWFDRGLLDQSTLLLLLTTEDEQPVGYARFERKEHEWVISVALAECVRGRGLGWRLIVSATALFRQRWNEQVVALVKTDNAPSLIAFRRAGYVDDNECTQGQGSARRLLYK